MRKHVSESFQKKKIKSQVQQINKNKQYFWSAPIFHLGFGFWSLSQLSSSEGRGTSWTSCNLLQGQNTERQTTFHTHAYVQFIVANETNMRVFGEEARVPRKNPHGRGQKNMQTPHREAQEGIEPVTFWQRWPLCQANEL